MNNNNGPAHPLAVARELAGVSKAELARRSGASYNALLHAEAGLHSRLTPGVLPALRLLGLDPDAAQLAHERAATVRRHAIDAWDAAGLDSIALHEARHTCASVLIASGANPKVIQRIMGHATIAMTFDQYGHLLPDGVDTAAAAANAYLSREVTVP